MAVAKSCENFVSGSYSFLKASKANFLMNLGIARVEKPYTVKPGIEISRLWPGPLNIVKATKSKIS